MTIRLRLTLWYASVLALVLAAVGAGTFALLSHALRESTDRSLVDLADAFTAVLADEEQEYPNLDAADVIAEAVSEFRYSDRRVALFGAEGGVVAASEPPSLRGATEAVALPPALEIRAAWTTEGRVFRTLASGPDGARMVAQPVSLRGRAFLAVAVGSLRDEAEMRRTLGWLLLWMVPAALLLASGGGYLLARTALAPVDAMGREAAEIDAGRLHARVSAPRARDELGRLAYTFNALLDRLERAFEQQRRFMADASHELRTPVAIIRGEADVALSRPDRDPASLHESLRVVGEEGRRLSRIVEDLFTLARADAGQHPLVPSDLYLDELAEECVRAYQSLAVDRGVHTFCRSPGEVSFRGDEALLRRMVLNLLDNAAKHTGPGGRVEVIVTSDPGSVRIEVADTGSGIPDAARPHVFERFYRADVARTRASGGAGLGLPIARWIAEAHGGSLELTDTGPRGTTFLVILPRDGMPLAGPAR